MVVADHFLWFFYFAEKAQEAKRYNSSSRRFRQSTSSGKVGPTFMDVAAFFAVCVWFVPLFLFLSLSANDNVLPRMGTFRFRTVRP
jgi:formate/nitrite transporter FocA (FNT family)